MVLPLPCSCLNQIQRTSVIRLSKRIASTSASTQAPQAVLIEKTLEQPVIVLREEDNVDIIGPPDPVSNLRPVIRKILKNESSLQQRYREIADATQQWNQEFWIKHNINFVKEKEAYIKQNTTREKPQLNADEMSEFYKDFLNKYWKTHVKYNFDWYGKNFTLLFLALRTTNSRQLGAVGLSLAEQQQQWLHRYDIQYVEFHKRCANKTGAFEVSTTYRNF